MKNIFVPTGTVTYLGTYTELMNVLSDFYPKMENDVNFSCYVFVPARRRHIVRGQNSFLFRGSILPSGHTYKITYKVYPTFSSSLFLLVPVYLLVKQLITMTDVGWQRMTVTLWGVGAVSAMFVGLFLLLRHLAIRQFVKYIEENDKENTGFFD